MQNSGCSKFSMIFHKNIFFKAKKIDYHFHLPFLLPAPFSFSSFQLSQALCFFFSRSSTSSLSLSVSYWFASLCAFSRSILLSILSSSIWATYSRVIVGLFGFSCQTWATKSCFFFPKSEPNCGRIDSLIS